MFPYTEKYNESESVIQNNNLLYNTLQQHQNTFDFAKIKEKTKFSKTKTTNFYLVIYLNSVIHIL